MIDSKLNFQNHSKIIESKLSWCIGILHRLKTVLPREVLRKIYFELFHPHLLYGLVAWGSMLPTYTSKLESLQNKTIKIIGGGTINENPTPFYSKLKTLKLSNLYKFETAKLVHDFLHDKLPVCHPLPYFLIFSQNPHKSPPFYQNQFQQKQIASSP